MDFGAAWEDIINIITSSTINKTKGYPIYAIGFYLVNVKNIYTTYDLDVPAFNSV